MGYGFNTDVSTLHDVVTFCEEHEFTDVFEGRASKTRVVKFLTHEKVIPGIFEKIIDDCPEDLNVTERLGIWSDFLTESGLNSERFQTQEIINRAVDQMAARMAESVNIPG